MINTPMTRIAMGLCYRMHHGQLDKSGVPYVFHPIHLAEQMKDEDSTIVALLHDVLEDTPCTAEQLLKMGFEPRVVEAIRLMTHPEGMDYMAYVARLGANPIARAVKKADLRHNSDLSRLDVVTEKDRERVKKYAAALALLETM